MKKNTIEAYKKAVKEKYEAEKEGVQSDFLVQPSRAKLRELCAEIFKENPSPSDLICFRAFLGFEFQTDNLRKLKTATDKFRPIETFFKGETDLNDLESVNMAAILVDFLPRPYVKFVKFKNAENTDASFVEVPTDVLKEDQTGQITVHNSPPFKPKNLPLGTPIFYKSAAFRKPIYWTIPLVLAVLLFYGYRAINPKECMQWKGDHYEIVHCKTTQMGFLSGNDISPINNQLVSLRKINVCDTTTFFKNEKPIVWYCKKDKKVEFFNGPSFHPENGKALKPITDYMINKYVLKEHQIPK